MSLIILLLSIPAMFTFFVVAEVYDEIKNAKLTKQQNRKLLAEMETEQHFKIRASI